MKCRELIELLNSLAPMSLACDWDNPGLLAGRFDKDIKKILLALDATDAVINQALTIGADFILTHHPLIFKPVKNINDGDFIGKRLIKMIQNDICCYAMHTNFDAAPGCMADLAADFLGLKEQRVLESMGFCDPNNSGDSVEYGIGKYGVLEKGLTLSAFSELVKQVFGIPFVTVYGDDLNKLIQKVAVCPGSGGSVMKEALQSGADVYVTGDVSHHEGIDAVANGLSVIDAGHYGVEHIFIDYMEGFLKEKMDGSISIEKAADAFPGRIL